jgi:hypothetical protein
MSTGAGPAGKALPAATSMLQRDSMREQILVRRRVFLGTTAGLILLGPRLASRALAEATAPEATLLSAPLELGGDWGASPPRAAAAVISRMREVSLAGVALLSDQQPDRLRVDNHTSGYPAVWLHDDGTRTAWLIVDIGPVDWSKLAYQFGHELGHVLCNSWEASAKPRTPSQWLEESMVEAFSIRGLGLLAESWARNPPFPGDAAFASAIRDYRANLIAKYKRAAGELPGDDMASWFRASRNALEKSALSDIEGPMILRLVAEMEGDKTCVEDLGAVNRWPERTGVSIEDYLSLWAASCSELRAPGRLPRRLESLLGFG